MIIRAIVPAFNRADDVAATVRALQAIGAIDSVLVVDDGSSDATAETAKEAGAEVLVLPKNVGKGGAVGAGLKASSDADVVVLIDADTAATASFAADLIGPVVRGEAHMTIARLPSAEGRGGFGLVRDVAAEGLEMATGRRFTAPLSGQRAIRASVIAGLEMAPRFGLEVGLTIDVHRSGGRILEVSTEFDHRHTGRTMAGFRHRAKQGRDLLRALRPRIGRIATWRCVIRVLKQRGRR